MDEIFEIQDFTNATLFEEFQHELEQKLAGMDANGLTEIAFEGAEFTLTHSKITSTSSGFLPTSRGLHHRMHGISECFILKPCNEICRQKLLDVGFQKLVLSASLLALSGHDRSSVAILIQIPPLDHLLYTGIQLHGELECRIRSTFINVVPKGLSRLDGILDMFNSTFGTESTSVNIALQRTYFISFEDHWPGSKLPIYGSSSFYPRLPHGLRNDPVRGVKLICTFSSQKASKYTENMLVSNIDPYSASFWLLEPDFDNIEDLFREAIQGQVIQRYINGWINELQNASSNNSRSNLSTLVHVLRNSGANSGVSIVDSAEVVDILKILLRCPEIDSENQNILDHPIRDDLVFQLNSSIPSVPYKSLLWMLCMHSSRILTGYPGHDHMIPSSNALFQILWCELLKVFRWHWENLILVPRLSTEKNLDGNLIFTSKLEVDLRWNLIHQKLSMLNYCIGKLREKARSPILSRVPLRHPLDVVPKESQEQMAPKIMKSFENIRKEVKKGNVLVNIFDKITHENLPIEENHAEKDQNWECDSAEEDEVFYDTQEIPNENEIENLEINNKILDTALDLVKIKTAQTDLTSPSKFERIGHLERLGDEILTNGEPLMIPRVNDPGFKSQDMIDDEQAVLEKLGTSDAARQLRAKLQSAQLLSDMMAFKAANPHAELVDFVKWHSPRDYIIDEHGNGSLSTRMSEDGNFWQDLWGSADPLPAEMQKPLFDPVQEGEKALHWLENLSTKSLMTFLLPTFIMTAFDVVYPNENSSSCEISSSCLDFNAVRGILLQKLTNLISRMKWSEADTEFTTDDIENLVQTFCLSEIALNMTHSLIKKFPNSPEIVKAFLSVTFPSYPEDSTFVITEDQQIMVEKEEYHQCDGFSDLYQHKETEYESEWILEAVPRNSAYVGFEKFFKPVAEKDLPKSRLYVKLSGTSFISCERHVK